MGATAKGWTVSPGLERGGTGSGGAVLQREEEAERGGESAANAFLSAVSTDRRLLCAGH